jgi:hypothetical protein
VVNHHFDVFLGRDRNHAPSYFFTHFNSSRFQYSVGQGVKMPTSIFVKSLFSGSRGPKAWERVWRVWKAFSSYAYKVPTPANFVNFKLSG